jgi:deoxyribodipyrimidine photo-lyase
MTKSKTFIHLHTLDLRIHDSPSLHLTHDPSGSLSSETTHFLPVYIFDSRQIDTSSLPGSTAPPNQAQEPASKQSANPNHRHAPTKTRNAPLSRTYSLPRTSPYRLRNLIEAVYGLRDSYRRSGGDMIIGWGKPEEVVPSIVDALKTETDIIGVGAQEEITVEEADMLEHLQSALKGVKLYRHDSKNLVPLDKLPFKVQDTPDLYTSFRKKLEGLGLGTDGGMIVPPLQTAVFEPNGKEESLKVSVGPNGTGLKPFPKLQLGGVNGIMDKDDKFADPKEMYAALVKPLIDNPPIGGWPENMKGTAWPELNANSAVPFLGSESAALARLDDYVGHEDGNDGGGRWVNGQKAKTYKATRNGLVGEAFSTKFAAFLALGTLSAKEAGWRVMSLLDRAGKDKDMWNNVYCECCSIIYCRT